MWSVLQDATGRVYDVLPPLLPLPHPTRLGCTRVARLPGCRHSALHPGPSRGVPLLPPFHLAYLYHVERTQVSLIDVNTYDAPRV